MKKTFLSALMLLVFLLGGCATKPQETQQTDSTERKTESTQQVTASFDFKTDGTSDSRTDLNTDSKTELTSEPQTDLSNDSRTEESSAPPTDVDSDSQTERENTSEGTDRPEDNPSQRNEKVDTMLQQMTLEEKVGQLFIIRPTADVRSPEDEPLKSMLNYPVGGIVFFAPNIVSPKQLTSFTQTLQAGSKIPLFLSIDEEGGTVTRIAKNSAFDVKTYKNAAAVGKSGDPKDATEMGFTIGSYLKQYGFNLNFAPVADVNTNPNNPVIGTRAFSSDPLMAAKMTKAMAEGLLQAGVAPTFKHFPGHGDTKEDSHDGLATVNKTLEELKNCELIPFQNLPENSCVMVGHLALPKVAEPHVPASLSKTVVSDLLRRQMGFDGVVVTDSLAMGAIKNAYTDGEAAIKAVEAGCDILLDPANFPQAFQGLCAAVQAGEISEERIDESVYRILCLKDSLGLLENP